jgi:hypothetical protein
VSGGHSGAFLSNEKTEALQFSIALQIARIPSRNNNQPTSASFQSFPIRGSINTASPCPLMPREARAFTPGSRHLFTNTRTEGTSAASESVASIGLIGTRLRVRFIPVNQANSRVYSNASRRNSMEGANALRHFFHRVGVKHYEESDRTHRLPVIVLSRLSHVENTHMGDW